MTETEVDGVEMNKRQCKKFIKKHKDLILKACFDAILETFFRIAEGIERELLEGTSDIKDPVGILNRTVQE